MREDAAVFFGKPICPRGVARVACGRGNTLGDHTKMHKNIHHYLAAIALIAWGAAAPPARAADNEPTDKPRVVVLCPECGLVSHIRRIDKPIAPERNLLPSITSSPQAGGMGNQTQAVPLLSFGRSGPQRVQREPTMRSAWEVTVRYDSGQFGFIMQDMEPDLKVGDRVRHIENTLEAMPSAAR